MIKGLFPLIRDNIPIFDHIRQASSKPITLIYLKFRVSFIVLLQISIGLFQYIISSLSIFQKKISL